MPDEEKISIKLNFRDHLGILYAKSFLKIIAILFVLMEFSIGRFPNLFISLIFLFVVYFSMPTSYRRDEPFKASEAWFRMLVGLFIATTLFLFLSPGTNIFDPTIFATVGGILLISIIVGAASYGVKSKWITFLLAGFAVSLWFLFLTPLQAGPLPQAAPIFFITLAFLATSPKLEKEEGAEKIEINIAGKEFREAIHSDNMENFGNGIFLALFFAGGFPIIFWLKGGLQLVLAAVWLMSGFVGYMSGREGRPYIGMIMIGFAVLAYSFQFTGTVGTAIFGNYWTPIYNFGSEAFAPLGSSLDAASRQINYAMCTITAGPGVCEGIINPPATPAGSTEALELTNFEAVNYRSGSPEINPTIPLVGTIQLDNRGDFSARSVRIIFNNPITFDPKKASLNNPTAAERPLTSDSCVFDSCFDTEPTGNKKTCAWTEPVSKGETKLLSFKCGQATDQAQWASLNKCVCMDPRTGKTMNETAEDCASLQCGTMRAVDAGTTPKACKCENTYTYTDSDGNEVTKNLFPEYCKTNANVLESYCKIEDSACKNKNGDPDCNNDACAKACNGQAGAAVKKYENAGWNLRIGFNYIFSYSANVSLPVKVMDKAAFIKKLQNREISLEDVNPAYSGGPVSVGIYVGKQPVRTEDQTIGTIYLTNNGQGKVKAGSTLRLNLSQISEGLSFSSEPKLVSASFNFKGKSITGPIKSCGPFDTARKVLECQLTADLNPEETGTITFSFAYAKLAGNAVEKNTLFVGGLDYTYEAEKNLAFPVIASPSQG